VKGSGTSSPHKEQSTCRKVRRPSVDSCTGIWPTDGLSSYRSVVPHARAVSGESRDTSGRHIPTHDAQTGSRDKVLLPDRPRLFVSFATSLVLLRGCDWVPGNSYPSNEGSRRSMKVDLMRVSLCRGRVGVTATSATTPTDELRSAPIHVSPSRRQPPSLGDHLARSITPATPPASVARPQPRPMWTSSSSRLVGETVGSPVSTTTPTSAERGKVAQLDVRAAYAGGRQRSSSSSQFGADASA
jgi:hypothetical protein